MTITGDALRRVAVLMALSLGSLLTAQGVSEPEVLPDAPGLSGAALNTPSHAFSRTTSPIYSFPDGQQRLRNYLAGTFGPGAFVAAGISAAVDQTHSLNAGYPPDGFPDTGEHPAHGTVPEWGEGFDGYAKRYASRYGMSLVSNTSRYGVGELLQEDVSYHRCECSGVLRRSAHAVEQSFLAHAANGKAVPSVPALVSPFVGAEVAVAGWYPARYNVSDALRTSTNLYLALPTQNFVSEFLRR